MGRSTSQRQPFQNIGCFDGGSRQLVKPGCGVTAGALGTPNPGIESSGAAAVNAVEAEEAGFSDIEASPQRASGERASERALEVPLSKTRTRELVVGSSGHPPTVQAQHLSALALHLCRDEELLALPRCARALLSGSLSS